MTNLALTGKWNERRFVFLYKTSDYKNSSSTIFCFLVAKYVSWRSMFECKLFVENLTTGDMSYKNRVSSNSDQSFRLFFLEGNTPRFGIWKEHHITDHVERWSDCVIMSLQWNSIFTWHSAGMQKNECTIDSHISSEFRLFTIALLPNHITIVEYLSDPVHLKYRSSVSSHPLQAVEDTSVSTKCDRAKWVIVVLPWSASEIV